MNRIIHNSDASYANIRSAAGLNSKVLFRMNNGQKVDTTGNKIHRDGYDWYEIYLDNDQYGWIAGHFIGYWWAHPLLWSSFFVKLLHFLSWRASDSRDTLSSAKPNHDYQACEIYSHGLFLYSGWSCCSGNHRRALQPAKTQDVLWILKKHRYEGWSW